MLTFLIDAALHGLRSFSSFAINDVSNAITFVGRTTQGTVRVVTLDAERKAKYYNDITDADSVVYSRDGTTLACNGRDPMVQFSREHLTLKLNNICGEHRIFECRFFDTFNLLMVWSDRPEVLLLDISEGVEVISRKAVKPDDAVIDCWEKNGHPYVSTWRSVRNEAVYTVLHMREGTDVLTTSKFRSPPKIIDRGWNAIIDSGVYSGSAYIADVLTGEVVMEFPGVSQTISLITSGITGDFVLRDNISIGRGLQNQVEAWQLRTGELSCAFATDKGSSTLCYYDHMIATLSIVGSGSRLQLRSIFNGSLLDTIYFDDKFLYLSSSPYGCRLLLLNDQLGSTSRVGVIDLRN